MQGEDRRDGRVVVSDGVELHYAVPGAGEPIVLLSGFAADSTFWAGMLPALAACRTVVTFDPRGSGRSSSPDSAYSVSVLGGDVLAVLRAAGLGSAHVVGHSMGAGVAQWLARHHPDAVSTLVLFNAAARLGTPGRAQPCHHRSGTIRTHARSCDVHD